MLHFIVYTKFFEKSSMEELGRCGKFKVVKKHINYMVIDATKGFLKKLGKSKPVFVYGAAAIESHGPISESAYLQSIYRTLAKAGIPRSRGIRIECIEINSKRGYSSKDLEVYLGKRLEKEGVKVDIVRPKEMFFIVLLDMHCYVGRSSDLRIARLLNPLRYPYSNGISRAEQKLKEAIEYFGIGTSGVAVDIGAAPGGWSYVLANRGMKVIAIDNGDLDAAKLKAHKVSVLMLRKGGSASRALSRCDILHVKASASRAASMLDLKAVDMVVDDTNIRAKDSAAAAMSYSRFMRSGATLIMTVKCVTRKVDKYMNEASEVLGREFEIRGVKALPSNRQEVMLYAVRK